MMAVTPPELPKGYYFNVTQGYTKAPVSSYSYPKQVNAKVQICKGGKASAATTVKTLDIPGTYDGSTPSDETIQSTMEEVLALWKKDTSFAGESPFGRYPREPEKEDWWDKLMKYFSPRSENN